MSTSSGVYAHQLIWTACINASSPYRNLLWSCSGTFAVTPLPCRLTSLLPRLGVNLLLKGSVVLPTDSILRPAELCSVSPQLALLHRLKCSLNVHPHLNISPKSNGWLGFVDYLHIKNAAASFTQCHLGYIVLYCALCIQHCDIWTLHLCGVAAGIYMPLKRSPASFWKAFYDVFDPSCRDWRPFSRKRIREVSYWYWVIRSGLLSVFQFLPVVLAEAVYSRGMIALGFPISKAKGPSPNCWHSTRLLYSFPKP